MFIQQSTTSDPLCFFMASAADGTTGVTGLSPTVTLSKAGAAFGAAAGAVSEIGSGWYKVAGNATDNNTLGELLLNATGTGAIASVGRYWIVAFNPRDAVRLGLTALPNAAANAAGGLPISTAGSLDMDDIGADVDAIETRVTLALPSVAPQAAGGLITSTAGSLDLDEMNVDIEAIQAKTDNLPASPAAVGSAMTLSNAGIDAILDRTDGVETSLTLRQALRVIFAACGAKVDGGGTTTIHFRDYGDAKNRITATVDTSGNRSAITYDLT